ncbi:GntR family transcriptional regulator [[Eubacterium] hominis]|uniref:GntR family transcriptional regulator n=1 Tax=[Eubacterium] hominis TaxID=2764325 RepID=UPI003A4E4403
MTPKYMKVYNAVKQDISRNVYDANDMLPSGEELANLYDCSVLTVKKALDKLVTEGYVVRKRGLGTFVKKIVQGDASKNAGVNEIYTTRRDLIRPGFTSIVERFDIIKSDEDMAKKLNIQPGDFVYYIIRVRLFHDQPRIVEYTWMPINVIKDLKLKDVEGSIYYYITKVLNLKIQSAHVSINAVRPNDIEKKYLNMKDTDFVCEVLQTAFLDNSQIFEYSIAHHIPEYFEFETTVIKELY